MTERFYITLRTPAAHSTLPAVLIPAYQPDGRHLLPLMHHLKEAGFPHILLVDDGSGAQYDAVFQEAARISGCHLIRYTPNRGKGAALKTGLAYLKAQPYSGLGVITMDSDGQHLVEDALKVADAMRHHPDALVLGVRDFSGPDVPRKSRLGNLSARGIFRLSTGKSCPDTQTGLRGIPSSLLPLALSETGTRYEYEMDFLEDAAGIAPLEFVPIHTVYENGNKGTHYRPVRDTLRIIGKPLRYAVSSLCGAAVDLTAFYLLMLVLSPLQAAFTTALATVLARLMSGFVNFLMNKYWSFGQRSRARLGQETAGYLALFFTQMALSAGLTTLLAMVLPALGAKILVDTSLFIISYYVQSRFIFINPERKKNLATSKRSKNHEPSSVREPV